MDIFQRFCIAKIEIPTATFAFLAKKRQRHFPQRNRRRPASKTSDKATPEPPLEGLIMTKLGLEPLYYRRRTHILRFVDECIANRVPRYLSNYFNVKNRDIHRHKTRNNNDLILEKINLECTKRAFFYKGAKIFNNF